MNLKKKNKQKSESRITSIGKKLTHYFCERNPKLWVAVPVNNKIKW